ncbi:hypothetical protein AALB_1251 [Agarivorans albus MKT 106]|uniref:Uncharacterized protein n=1 Tax=Agarivorans albus MKT 106 TaxID=1331007 RepID=R9PSN5_AGAAL|nr:hypothetical protein AALB_1251 [Agarivorans albus MKT 106]
MQQSCGALLSFCCELFPEKQLKLCSSPLNQVSTATCVFAQWYEMSIMK